MRAAAARRGEAGRGFLGFLVALAVVGFVGHAALRYYDVQRRAYELDDYAYRTIQEADRLKQSEEDVRAALYKRALELQVPIQDVRRIEVVNDNVGWRVRVEYDLPLKLPGYTRKLHYVIDHTWKRF